MNVICPILFAFLLTASHMAFAEPVSSDDPLCVGSERYKIIGLTIICQKLFDGDYECPSGSYLDFKPEPPICRYNHDDKKSGDASLKPMPASIPSPKTESSDESKTNPVDTTNKPSLFDNLDNSLELINPDRTVAIIILAVVVIAIIPIAVLASKRGKKKTKYNVKPMSDLHAYKHDSKIPTGGPEPTTDSRETDIFNKLSTIKEKPVAVRQAASSSDTQTPTQEHDSSWNLPIIVIDTNILFDYAGFEPNADEDDSLDSESHIRRYKAIQRFLDYQMERKTLYVPIEVFYEFLIRSRKKINNFKSLGIESRISPITNYVGVDNKKSELYDDKSYYKIPGTPDTKKWNADLNKVAKSVFEFYKGIHNSTDPETVKMREAWETRKRRRDPKASLINRTITSKKDNKILATVIQLQDVNPGRNIKLLSRDGDFTIFKPLIDDKYKITIMDGYSFED